MSFLSRIESIQKSAYLYEMEQLCWKEVLSEPTGLEIIRAAKIFRNKFNPVFSKTAITFPCGRVYYIEVEVVEALKKDSHLFNSFFSFESECVFNLISYEDFETLLKVLYEDASFDEINILIIANYFDIPSLFYKAFNKLKDNLLKYTPEQFLECQKRLIKLLQFSFANEAIERLSEECGKYNLELIVDAPFVALSQTITTNFSCFTQLRTLRFSSCDNIDAFQFPTTLRNLSLFRCKISDKIMSFIPSTLNSLSLACTNITDNGLRDIPKSLTALNVGGCDVSDEGLFNAPQSIIELNVSYTKVTIASLSRLTSLTRLNISGLKINRSDWSRLKVEDLTLSGVLNDDISYLPRRLRKLYLFDSKVSNLEGAPQELIEFCAPNCVLQDASLKYFSCCLTIVNLFKNTFITAEGIKHLPRSIRSLNLCYCCKIDDAAIGALSSLLLYLNVSKCNLITNIGMRSLPKTLTELNISGCGNITDDAIPYFPISLAKIYSQGTKITKTL